MNIRFPQWWSTTPLYMCQISYHRVQLMINADWKYRFCNCDSVRQHPDILRCFFARSQLWSFLSASICYTVTRFSPIYSNFLNKHLFLVPYITSDASSHTLPVQSHMLTYQRRLYAHLWEFRSQTKAAAHESARFTVALSGLIPRSVGTGRDYWESFLWDPTEDPARAVTTPQLWWVTGHVFQD